MENVRLGKNSFFCQIYVKTSFDWLLLQKNVPPQAPKGLIDGVKIIFVEFI